MQSIGSAVCLHIRVTKASVPLYEVALPPCPPRTEAVGTTAFDNVFIPAIAAPNPPATAAAPEDPTASASDAAVASPLVANPSALAPPFPTGHCTAQL